MKHKLEMLLVMIVAVTFVSCASTFKGVDAGEGSVFLRGRLTAILGSALPKVEVAVHEAMEELNFVAVETVSDKLKGTVKAQMADGTKVKVKIEAQDFESTQVTIRVGSFGDQSISVQILKHVKRRL
ncbi:MAG: DUF3568 domain-containing protein [Thermoanaerobaculales bacterium]|nr:DUF3568 domain-containing protein [Thermoanaerobaculales bacterium]